MTAWNHQQITANGIRIHYVRHGAGFPLVLLHGWPEFWYVWRKNILPLAERFDVIVPDLRGFGDSEKPPTPPGQGTALADLVDDLKALADGLGLPRFGIVSHDVGAFIAQEFARRHPERLLGLYFFDCPYPGIGRRWAEPDHLREIWYQSFHQLPWAAELVGLSRRSCELYIGHFLRHWAHDPHAFDEDLAVWVDNFLKPGNLQGGFNWYIGINEARLKVMREGPPALPKISVPTRVRWGVSDKVLKVAWADRLDEYFSRLSFAPFPEAGHFPHYEQPDAANRDISAFFSGLLTEQPPEAGAALDTPQPSP